MDEKRDLVSNEHPRYLLKLLVAISVFLCLGTMAIRFLSDFKAVFEPPLLLPINSVFAGLIPICVSIIAARGYPISGLNSLLSMGCGMMVFGCGAVLVKWLIGSIYALIAVLSNCLRQNSVTTLVCPSLSARLINRIFPCHTLVGLSVVIVAALLSVTYSHALDLPANTSASQRLNAIIEDNYHPYSFLDDKNEPAGFSIDIAKSVAKEMDLELEMRAGRWDLAMNELEAGSIDMIPLIAYTPERGKLFDFTVPYTIVYDAIFFKKGTQGIRSLKDLSGKIVIVTNNDLAHNYLLSSGLSETMSIIFAESGPDALKQLAAGKGDAAIMPKLIGLVTVKKLHMSDIETSPILIDGYSRTWCMAVKRGNQALLDRLNQGLSIIKNSGEYDAIYRNWFGAMEGTRFNLKTILKFSSIAVLILLGFIGWNALLKQQVFERTAQLETLNRELKSEITDRRAAELKLMDALIEAQRFREALDNAPAYIYMKDNQAHYIYANRPTLELFGCSAEELVDSDDTRFFPPDTVKRLHEVEARVFLGEKTSEEIEVVDAEGRVHIYGEVKTPIYEQPESKTVWGLLGISTDITERKRAEEALRESEQEFRTLTEAMPQIVWITRPDGWNIYFNQQWVDYTGMTLEESYGQGWNIPFHPDDRQRALDAWQQATATEGIYSLECRLLRSDGAYRWWLIRGVPVHNAEGKIHKWFGTCTDIDEIKMAAEKVLASSMQLEAALASMSDAVFISDTEGRFIEFNDAFATFHKFRNKEECAKTFAEYPEILEVFTSDGELAPVEQWAVPRALRGETATNAEYTLRRKDTGETWVGNYSLAPIRNKDGMIVGSVVTGRDITEQKKEEEEKAKLEAHLQQAQKMDTIGSLAGGIAHDLNNILFPISGLSEMLLDDIPPETPEHDSIEQIYKSAMRGSELVKQILAFSRQSKPQKLPIRIQPIVKEVLKLSRSAIPSNIEITSHISTDCGMVSADPTQVHQIMMNLITNAYHAVEQTAGTIYVELKETVFGIDDLYDNSMKSGKYACITITDTGTGIDQTLINKIFDPYFTTKEMGKGTGLGLSVVHGIVKQHGGDIRVYSEVGKGTAFNVYLPLLEDAKDNKTAAVTRNYPKGCERILLVDDEAPIVRMEQMMLERQGYHVTTRTSSLDALETFRANPSNFDIVISDRTMPNMTGEQLAREIISIKPGIPFIINSGFSDENDEKRGKAIGIKGFLMKPVATVDLAEMVRKVLDEVAEGERVHDSGQADIIVAKNTGTPGRLLKDQGNC